MRKILDYLSGYWDWLDKRLFFLSTVFTALLVFLNYHFDINQTVSGLPFAGTFFCWTLIFSIAFSFAYILYGRKEKTNYFHFASFRWLFLAAVLLFAWKMCFPVQLILSKDPEMNVYLNAVIYWPVKLVFITACLYLIWKKTEGRERFYGTGTGSFRPGPYLMMLLFMVPLVYAAATRPEFQSMYPRYDDLFLLRQMNTGPEKLLFELSYGSDFFTIELFFRGFLVLAFSKWAGKAAILPMAMFYCTIHFGKPLGECISSYFGGLLLGIVTYHTRSIWGGLMVHLGIAWMMELAGYLSKL